MNMTSTKTKIITLHCGKCYSENKGDSTDALFKCKVCGGIIKNPHAPKFHFSI